MKYTMESYTIYSETEGKIKPIAIVLFDEDEEGQFIVTACNCHEELVRALEKLYTVWRDQVDTSGELASINIPIEEILAKAKEEQR